MEKNAKETLEKLAYLAIGLFSPENGQFSDIINGWVEKGKLTEEEGRKFVQEITDRAKGIRKDVEDKIREESEQFYNNIHVATTEQIEALVKRVEELEAKVAKLQG